MRGFDRYLMYQFRMSGEFMTYLFQAIQKADEWNLEKLERGFPEEVQAYKTWSRVGQAAFLEGCSPDHPLVKAVKAGEKVL